MSTRAITRLYIPIALVVTLAMYSKYSIAGCAIALAAGLLLTGHVQLLRSRRLAFGVALVVVLLLPNAIWQIVHGLPMLEVIHNDQLNRHALANGMADESPNRWINALYMFGLQFAIQQPALRAGVGVGFGVVVETAAIPLPVRGVSAAARDSDLDDRARLLHPGHVSGAVRGGRGGDRARVGRRAAAVAAAGAARRGVRRGVSVFPLSLPVLSLPAYMAYERAIGLSRPAPPDGKSHLINPMFADQLGWKTMTQTVAGAYWSLPPAQRRITALFADRYAYAGALDYYGPRYGLPTVISPNNQYYLWGTRGYSGQSMLAVGATDYYLLLHWFGSVQQIAVYRNDYRWMLEGPLPIYICTRPRVPLAAMWPAFKYYGL